MVYFSYPQVYHWKTSIILRWFFCLLFYSVNPDVLRRGRRLECYLVYGNTTRNPPKTIVKQNQSQKLESCASQNIVQEVSILPLICWFITWYTLYRLRTAHLNVYTGGVCWSCHTSAGMWKFLFYFYSHYVLVE